jgi:hypothetical protein
MTCREVVDSNAPSRWQRVKRKTPHGSLLQVIDPYRARTKFRRQVNMTCREVVDSNASSRWLLVKRKTRHGSLLQVTDA